MGINLGQTSTTSTNIQGATSQPNMQGQGLLNLDMGRPTPTQPTTPAPDLISLNLEKVQTPTGLSLNLEKGLSLDLEKDIAGKPLNRIRIGLGWDPIPGQSVDLDTFCLLLEDGHVRTGSNVIYFKNISNAGITHNGDNRTGEGENDDETIDIVLSEISPKVNKILVFANIYEAEKTFKTFGSLSHAYIRLMNMDEQIPVGNSLEPKELCRFVLPSAGATFNAFKFCELERVNGVWKFNSVGEATNGDIVQIANAYI